MTREQKAWLVAGFCNSGKGCSIGCALLEICKNNHDDFIFCEVAQLDECLKIIAPNVLDESKSAALPQWISVEDKLPDGSVPVIICRKHGKDAVKVEQGCLDGNGWWLSYGAGWTKSVTHWMPLPEPPEVDVNA